MSGSSPPVLLEVRERRSRFGRIVRWSFWIFQLVMVALTFGTCALVTPYVGGPDPEVAMGAGMFGAMALGTLWTVWPTGTILLGALLLATRGRKRLIPAPPEGGVGAVPPAASPAPPAAAGPPPPSQRRPGGSVPQTGGARDGRP